MKKYFKFIILGFIALIFIGTFIFLYRKSLPEKIEYQEFKPTTGEIRKSTVVTGKIEPRDQVSIKPQIAGIISELYKQAGDAVSINDIIAKLKVIPDMSSLSSAQSRVRLAEINLEQAEKDFKRMNNLYKQKLISGEDYDKAKVSLEQSKEEKVTSEDALQIIKEGASRRNAKESSTFIRSTINGIVLDIPVKVGNSVIQSNSFNDGTTIATVANMQDLIFRGNVDETEVGQLTTGMPMKITIGALQDLTFNAKLEYISPQSVENNGANQFEIKAAINVSGTTKIRSGYSANAEIVLQSAEKVLMLPESAIEFNGDSTFVYIIKGDGEKKTYSRRQITVGISDGLNIEIKKGITIKDRIRGPQMLKETASNND